MFNKTEKQKRHEYHVQLIDKIKIEGETKNVSCQHLCKEAKIKTSKNVTSEELSEETKITPRVRPSLAKSRCKKKHTSKVFKTRTLKKIIVYKN